MNDESIDNARIVISYLIWDSRGNRRMAFRFDVILLAGLLMAVTSAGHAADPVPDLNGVWLATTPRSAIFAGLPELTPRAKSDMESFDPLNDPVIRCVPPGFPRSGLIIYPFEIVQTEDILVFLYESFGLVRRIYMDGRAPPSYLPPFIAGYSIGHWEKGELVVNTTHIAEGLLSGGGIRQYGDVSVVERYRLDDNGHALQAEITIAAPETFAAPWTRSFTWELDPNGMIYESICDPADSRF